MVSTTKKTISASLGMKGGHIERADELCQVAQQLNEFHRQRQESGAGQETLAYLGLPGLQ